VIAGEVRNTEKPEVDASDLFSIWKEADYRILKPEQSEMSINGDERASLLHKKEPVIARGSFLDFVGMFIVCLLFPFLVPVPLLKKKSKNFIYGKMNLLVDSH
jgi:hypothetical protein